MPENPFALSDEAPSQRPRTLTDALRDAHGRRLNALTEGMTTFEEAEEVRKKLPFDAFVSQVISELEEGGHHERAKAVRDWRVQKQGNLLNARSEEAFLRQAQADGRVKSGLGILAERLNPFSQGGLGGDGGLGSREEQLAQAKHGPSLLRSAEQLAFEGVQGFTDVASLGLAKNLQEHVIRGRQLAGDLPTFAGQSPLQGMSAKEIRKQGEQANAENLRASGVDEALIGGFRAAGELIGFFTAAGYVSRAGNMLKVAPGLGRAGSIAGRALQNPIVNFIAAEGLVSEGEIQAASLRGEEQLAQELREGQGARLANAGAFALFAPAAKFFGRVGQNALLKVTGGSKGVKIGEALGNIPGLWNKVRAVGAHLGGKGAEFMAFGFVPNVYSVNREGETEMSPWFTTVLNPAKIEAAIKGGKGREEYLDALTTIAENGIAHAGQGGVTGTILGLTGLRRGAPIGDRSTFGRDVRETFRLGERGVGGQRQFDAEERASREVNLRALREARKTLSPAERKALKESIREGIEASDNPEQLIEGITQYVTAAAEIQKKVLQQNRILPLDMRSTADLVREKWESDLGSELFQGRLKDADSPGTGTTVEVKNDPDRPGRPGREGEVLEIIETKPPDAQSAADPERRTLRLARVRFEDGTVGMFDMNTLEITGSRLSPRAEPGADRPGPGGSNAGAGEAARGRGTQGTFGRVRDNETGAVGELVRAHTSEDGRRLVDVRVGGELRTFDADRFEVVEPNRLPEREVDQAPGAGTGQPGTTRQERTSERLDKGEVERQSLEQAADRMAEGGATGLLDRIKRGLRLTESEAMQQVDRQIRQGRVTGADAIEHQGRVVREHYAQGEKAVSGRGGNLLKAYRGLRRRFAGGKDRTAPKKLLGKMKATWDAMSPEQRTRVLQGIEDRLPHEKPGEGLDAVLERLGVESRFTAPQEPQERAEPAGEAAAAPKPKAPERAAEAQEAPKEPAAPEKVTVPAPKGVPKDTGERRRAGEIPKGETPEQRRMRRLRSVSKGRKAQAFVDSLTGRGNKRAFDKAAARSQDGVMVVDVTGLKARNDAKGQEAGDQLLQEGSKHLVALAKKAGISERNVFRVGGDEFGIAGVSRAKMDRLLELIEEQGRFSETAIGEGKVGHEIVGAIGADLKAAGGEGLTSAKERSKARRKEAGELAERSDIEAAAKAEKTAPAEGEAPERESTTPRESPLEAPFKPIPESVGDQPVARGGFIEIRQEGTSDRVPAEYVVVPAESILPSHQPGTLKPSKGYPEGLQPRDYERDTFERDKVDRIARQFDPAEVVNTAPRADAGPPTVAWDGKKFVVLNGNGRSMGMLEALKNPDTKAAYEEYLRENAGQFGLSDVPDGGVLVRAANLDPSGKSAREFAPPRQPSRRAAAKAHRPRGGRVRPAHGHDPARPQRRPGHHRPRCDQRPCWACLPAGPPPPSGGERQ